jgi:hypothetical protein
VRESIFPTGDGPLPIACRNPFVCNESDPGDLSGTSLAVPETLFGNGSRKAGAQEGHEA